MAGAWRGACNPWPCGAANMAQISALSLSLPRCADHPDCGGPEQPEFHGHLHRHGELQPPLHTPTGAADASRAPGAWSLGLVWLCLCVPVLQRR